MIVLSVKLFECSSHLLHRLGEYLSQVFDMFPFDNLVTVLRHEHKVSMEKVGCVLVFLYFI